MTTLRLACFLVAAVIVTSLVSDIDSAHSLIVFFALCGAFVWGVVLGISDTRGGIYSRTSWGPK